MTAKHPKQKPAQKQKRKPWHSILLASTLVLAAGASFAASMNADAIKLALTRSPATAPAAEVAAAVPAIGPAKAQPPTLSQRQAQYIVRTTLKSLHDAVRTGNFTVFRDLSGPSLQARFKAAELHKHFEAISNSDIDLASVSFLSPILTSAKAIGGSNMIRLDGYFASTPTPLAFGMIVEPHNGSWLVADYALDAAQARQVAFSGAQPATGGQ